MTITLNNGVSLDVYGCGQSGDTLHIDIPAEIGFVEAAKIFDDPAATSVITYRSEVEVVDFEGFTHISRIGYSPWVENALAIVLEKGV